MAERSLADRFRPSSPSDGWQPAVDGLRGLAVLAVLLYHADPSAVPGGYLGVSLFFTLSGYLITTLLLREHEGSGRIAISRFWGRRARRLVPVAVAGLVLATVVAWLTLAEDQLSAVMADVRWAAANLANWHLLGAGSDYGDAVAAPSPVTHYWSLAIEEQFYLVYPLVATLALRAGRRALGVVLVVATLGSLLAQILAASPNRAYLGTDTRLAELTIGALLALALAARPVRSARPATLDVIGAVGLGSLAAAWYLLPLGDFPMQRGGLVVHALVAAVVLVAVLHGHRVRQALSFGPLVTLGLLSYGVYVVHFPLFLWLTPDRIGLDGPALLIVRVAASIALAVVLHALVERPVRWGGSLPGWQGALGWITATAAVLVVGAALSHVAREAVPADGLALNRFETSVVTMPDPERDVVEAAAPSTSTTAPVANGGGDTATPPEATPSGGSARPASNGPARALRLLVVGDSTAAATGRGMQRWAQQTGAVAVDVVSGPGCAFEQTGVAVLRDGWELPARPACLELLDTARSVAREHPPDAVVVFIGSTQLADWRFGPTREAIGEPAFEAKYLQSANASLASLESLGAPVLWATVPVPSWDPTIQYPGNEPPGSGPLTMNDATRTARLNKLNDTIVSAHPLVRLVPYAALISEPDGSVDRRLRPDGLHLEPEEVPRLMADGLEAALRDAYRRVLQVRPESVRSGTVVWSL